MMEQPGTQVDTPEQGKLVLPAYPDQERYTTGNHPPVRPEQLTRQVSNPPPQQPLAKLAYFWQKDPAYKVLFAAIALVVLAGIVFVSLASAAFLHNPNLFAQNNTGSKAPATGAAPAGTVDFQPTFAPPGGGQGSSQSSQPPAHSTPVIQVTQPTSITPTTPPNPNPTSTPTPGSGGPLTVQLTGIPTQVSNNSTVTVGINTSEPNVTVKLEVTYNVAPYFYQSGSQVTDENGNADISWVVHVARRGFGRVIANVVAVATDQSGQTASSPAVKVEVLTSGNGL